MDGWLLEIDAPPANWCQETMAAFPDHQIRVHLIVPTSGNRCIESVTVAGPDPDAVLRSLERHPHVAAVVETGRDRETVRLRLTLRGCPVADVTRTTGLAPRLPFVVLPGKDVWMVLGQEAALQAARADLDAQELSSRIVGKGAWTGPETVMTEHQRHVLHRAVETGYYEYPRRTSLTALAGELGVAKSTLSQTLMVIEMKLAFDFMERPERVTEHDAARSASHRRTDTHRPAS